MSKIIIEEQTIKDAMHAIAKLQGFLGIDLSDYDSGYGETYEALQSALDTSEKSR